MRASGVTRPATVAYRRAAGHSDIQEHGFAVTPQPDVEPIKPRRSRLGDQGCAAVDLFDEIQRRVGRVVFASGVHPRVKPDADAPFRDPEVDMRAIGRPMRPMTDPGLSGPKPHKPISKPEITRPQPRNPFAASAARGSSGCW
jgi:hypothetical protein